MNIQRIVSLASLVLAITLSGNDALARGFRGGGGGGGFHGGGGGGFSGGGGYHGGGFSGGVNRSPSMSRMPSGTRSQSNFSRPQTGISRPQQGISRPTTRPTTRPSTGSLNRSPGTNGNPGLNRTPSNRLPSGTRPGQGIGNIGSGSGLSRGPSSFSRPTQNDLGNFLNLPASGRPAANARSSSGTNRPSTLPSGPRSFETDRGGTITIGGRGGSTDVGGGTIGGGAGGIKVETAGGKTFTKAGGAIGATDGTNAAVRGGSATAAQGNRGSIANVKRGYADTAGNRAGGSVTAAQNRRGYTAVAGRGGYSSGGTGQIRGGAAVRGPGGNVVAGGRGAAFVNGQFVGGRSWTTVNGNYTRWNTFTPGWYGRYPGAWWPGKWAVYGTAWAVATWPYASAYCGCTGEPTYYDYGTNVYYSDDDQVYVDDQPVASAEEYYNQADEIAESGEQSQDEEWMPLGVFGIVADEDQTQTDKVVQLAVNRDGAIQGNYQDMLTNQVTPVKGAVDKESQRVTFKLEGNDDLVVETGLYNLTNDEVPVLVHMGPDKQEGRLFIRLKQPEDQAGGTDPAGEQKQPTNG